MTLTKNDFEKFEELVETVLDRKLEERLGLESGQTLDQKLDEKLKYLPTKEEFYNEEDKLMKKLKDVEEQMEILNGLHGKVNQHETRIEKLEEKLLA